MEKKFINTKDNSRIMIFMDKEKSWPIIKIL